MNMLPLIHFTSLENFVKETPTYTWLNILDCWFFFFFTNIPLDENIDICIGKLYNGNEDPRSISKHGFRKLLSIATKELLFLCLTTNIINK